MSRLKEALSLYSCLLNKKKKIFKYKMMFRHRNSISIHIQKNLKEAHVELRALELEEI